MRAIGIERKTGTSTAGTGANLMFTEENKAVARRFCEEVWNKGNLDFIDELLAPDHINHEFENPRQLGEGQSREGIKQGLRAYRTAFSDL